MNLQRARYLVALADEKSFTRAAVEMHVAQSALSQQIKVLEREVGVTLIDRRGPRISLTAAGEVAVREARFLLASADRAVQRIRQAAAGLEGELRVAHTRSWAGGVIADLINEYRRTFPGIEVSVYRGWTTRNADLAAEGSIDVAVIRPPIDSLSLIVRILESEQLLIAVPESHPFAGHRTIDRDALIDQPVVFWPRENGPGMYDRIVEQLWPKASPTVVRNEADDEQVLYAVAAGVGIAPIPRGRARTFRVPGVHLCEVAGPPMTLDVGIAYRPDNPNPALQCFLALIGNQPSGRVAGPT
ncbi:MAG: LysR family transcriptional regulator [Rhodococcus sp. (in: high G+C Gram-positive bacteria)]|nr:MAG: LysR family transcriptional regulator [Rhodococcus sp. (in: high G+C Gram-positive bacteria)]